MVVIEVVAQSLCDNIRVGLMVIVEGHFPVAPMMICELEGLVDDGVYQYEIGEVARRFLVRDGEAVGVCDFKLEDEISHGVKFFISIVRVGRFTVILQYTSSKIILNY